MFCGNCGKEIPENGAVVPKFCPSCGSALNLPASAAAQTPGPGPGVRYTQQPAQGPGTGPAAGQASYQAHYQEPNPMATPPQYMVTKPRGKGGKRKIIIIAAAAVAVVVAVTAVYGNNGLGGHKNPLSLMYYSTQKTFETPGGCDISARVGYSGFSVNVDLKAKLGKDLNSSAFDVEAMGFRGIMADGSIAFGRGDDPADYVAIENAVNGFNEVIKDEAPEDIDIDFNQIVKNGKFNEDWYYDFLDKYYDLISRYSGIYYGDYAETIDINALYAKENIEAGRDLIDDFFLNKCEERGFTDSFVTDVEESRNGSDRTIDFNLDYVEFASAFMDYIAEIYRDESRLRQLGFNDSVIDLIDQYRRDIDDYFDSMDEYVEQMREQLSDYSANNSLRVSAAIGRGGVLKEISLSLDVAGTEAQFSLDVEKAGGSTLDEGKIKEELGAAGKSFDGSSLDGWSNAIEGLINGGIPYDMFDGLSAEGLAVQHPAPV
jgi:hypothetical protein